MVPGPQLNLVIGPNGEPLPGSALQYSACPLRLSGPQLVLGWQNRLDGPQLSVFEACRFGQELLGQRSLPWAWRQPQCAHPPSQLPPIPRQMWAGPGNLRTLMVSAESLRTVAASGEGGERKRLCAKGVRSGIHRGPSQRRRRQACHHRTAHEQHRRHVQVAPQPCAPPPAAPAFCSAFSPHGGACSADDAV